MGKIKRFMMAAAVLAAAPAIGLSAAGIAHAGTGTACTGGRCSGLDPNASFNSSTGAECGGNATSPRSASAFGGSLELRWGPNCQVNWTRFTPANNHRYQIWVTNQTTGVWAGDGLYKDHIFTGRSGVAEYSDQVWAGPDPASACVDDLTAGGRTCVSQG